MEQAGCIIHQSTNSQLVITQVLRTETTILEQPQTRCSKVEQTENNIKLYLRYAYIQIIMFRGWPAAIKAKIYHNDLKYASKFYFQVWCFYGLTLHTCEPVFFDNLISIFKRNLFTVSFDTNCLVFNTTHLIMPFNAQQRNMAMTTQCKHLVMFFLQLKLAFQ